MLSNQSSSQMGLVGTLAVIVNTVALIGVALFELYASVGIILVPIVLYAFLIWLGRRKNASTGTTAAAVLVTLALASLVLHYVSFGEVFSGKLLIVALGTVAAFLLGPVIILLPLSPFVVLLLAVRESRYSLAQSLVAAVAGAAFAVVCFNEFSRQMVGHSDAQSALILVRLPPILLVVALFLSVVHIGDISRASWGAVRWALGSGEK